MTSPDSTDSPDLVSRDFFREIHLDRSPLPIAAGALGPSTDDRPSDDRKWWLNDIEKMIGKYLWHWHPWSDPNMMIVLHPVHSEHSDRRGHGPHWYLGVPWTDGQKMGFPTDEKIQLIHGWFRMEDPMDDLRGTPPIVVNLNIWDCFICFERETPSHHGLQFSDFQERHESQWPQWWFTRWRKQTSKVWKSVTYRGTLNWWSTTPDHGYVWFFWSPYFFISEHHHVPIFRSITALIYMDILYNIYIYLYIYSIFRQTHINILMDILWIYYGYTMDILWIYYG